MTGFIFFQLPSSKIVHQHLESISKTAQKVRVKNINVPQIHLQKFQAVIYISHSFSWEKLRGGVEMEVLRFVEIEEVADLDGMDT